MATPDTPASDADRVPLPSLAETVRRLERQGVERLEGLEEVARGGMGVIFKAHDPSLARDVAMKVILGDDGVSSRATTLRPDDEDAAAVRRTVARFVVEAQVTARLDHPGVVPVHRLGVDERGRVFFTMRLVRGRALDAVLGHAARGEEGWSLTQAVQVLLKVCDTLSYAHSRGVIHRDVKPANVMVGAYGEVYVMDWGLAKWAGEPAATPAAPGDGDAAGPPPPAAGPDAAADAGLTSAGSVVGTPTYLAPETAEGRPADVRSDVYAVGAMLYELLAGAPPYARESREQGTLGVLRAVLGGPPAPLGAAAPRAPLDLVAVTEKAMARDRAARYASVRELGQDLQSWLEGRVVLASRHGPLVELRKWIGRNRGTAIAAAAAVLAGVVGAVAYGLRERAANADLGRSLQRETAARAAAQTNERRADGLRAATLAVSLAPKDPALALRLALEAHERAPGRFANAALAEAWLRHRELRCLRGHDAYVEQACWSPSGARLASLGADGTLIVWDAETGALERRLAAAAGPPYLAVFLDEQRLLVRTGERTLTTYDATTAAVVRTFEVDADVACLATSADGASAFVGGPDGVVRTLATGDGRETARWRAGAGAVRELAVEGGVLAAAVAGGPVRAWRTADGAPLGTFPPEGAPAAAGAPGAERPSAARVSPDGRWLATLGDGVGLWETATGRRVGWWPTGSSSWCCFPSGGTLASLGGDRGPWVLYDLDAGHVRRSTPTPLVTATSSADAALLVERGTESDAAILDARTGRRLAVLAGHAYAIKQVAFRRDGRRLATASADMTLRTWDTGFEDLSLAADRALAAGVVPGPLDPSGRQVVVGRAPGPEAPPPVAPACDVLDARTGAVVATLEGARVGDLTWTPDGTRLLCAPDDGTLRLFDAATGRCRWSLEGGWGARPLPSPDARRAALRRTRDGAAEVALLDLDAGEVRGTVLRDLPAILHQGGWSPDGTRLAVGGDYGLVRVVDLAAGSVTRVPGHGGMVIAAAFSPDGATLYTSAVDSTVCAWDARTGEPRWRSVGFPMHALPLQVARDGRHLLVDAAYLLDAATGTQVVDLSNARDAGWTVRALDPEDRLWLTSLDGRVRRTMPRDLVRAALGAGPRALSPGEEERLGLIPPEALPARLRAWAERFPSGRAWQAAGDRCLAAGDVEGARAAFERVRTLAPTHGWGEYGLALALARRLGDTPADDRPAAQARILELLEQARDRGYPPWDRLQRDPDLAPLRGLERYRALELREPATR